MGGRILTCAVAAGSADDDGVGAGLLGVLFEGVRGTAAAGVIALQQPGVAEQVGDHPGQVGAAVG